MACTSSVDVTRSERPVADQTSPMQYSIEISRGSDADNGDICDRCLSLNLPGLFRAKNGDLDEIPAPWSKSWPAVANVGHRYKDIGVLACSWCKIICASRLYPKIPTEGEGLRIQGCGEEIVAVEMDSSRDRSFYGLHFASRNVSKALRLVLCPEGYSERDHELHWWYEKPTGQAFIFRNKRSIPNMLPRLLPHTFDPNTVKSWLQFCAENHNEGCTSKPLPVRGVKVIDCVTLTVDEYRSNTSYIALSYVWGNTGSASEQRRLIEGTKLSPYQLPAVIMNAIEVTKLLGYRYLWIDKYCINQDQPELKHDQIRQMGVIYRNAELTLIAAAGTDENYGLPGVRTREASRQLITKAMNMVAIWAKNPRDATDQSHWSTRGWTFQEMFLSRRRLVFTDDEIYFECRAMRCFESLDYPIDAVDGYAETKFRGWDIGMSHRTEVPIYDTYLSAVSDYTARDLRFDTDSLNAFRGLLQEFSQHQNPLSNVWGLCYPLHVIDPESYFGYSLTWIHKENGKRPRRRSGFPSWTWAGWAGQAEYNSGVPNLDKDDFVRDHTFSMRLRDLRFTGLGNGLVELKDVTHEDDYSVLHITAATIPMIPASSPLTADSKTSWTVNSDGMRLPSGNDLPGNRHSIIKLLWSADTETYDAYLASYSDTSRWICILIGQDWYMCFVMVLEAVSHTTWQRVGMFCIFDCTFSDTSVLREERYRSFNIV